MYACKLEFGELYNWEGFIYLYLGCEPTRFSDTFLYKFYSLKNKSITACEWDRLLLISLRKL